jgi:hypothetical protein
MDVEAASPVTFIPKVYQPFIHPLVNFWNPTVADAVGSSNPLFNLKRLTHGSWWLGTPPPPLSSEFGTIQTARAEFWPGLEPFFMGKSWIPF